MNGTHPFLLDLDMTKKYIDAEKLKAEIERRYAEYKAKQKTDDFTYYEGMADALDLFEQFIDSLQQEQPSEDLESEIEKYFQGLWPGMETADQCNTDMHFTPPAIMRLATYFYELGKKSK